MRRLTVAGLWFVVVLLGGTIGLSLVLWQRDLAEIREVVSDRIDPNAPPEEIVLAAREFIRDEVGYGRKDSYFLLPMFRFMRPTALQVIREGGDCAYRTRAFIVILREFDIKASKLALYNDEGRSVHAVAAVQVPGGPKYVDLLFNLAHENDQGEALTLAQLADREVLRASVERAVAHGNERAELYPLLDYDFEDPRSINWNKNAILILAYDGLRWVLGDDVARRFPRPHLSEEPALMVVVVCSGATMVCLLLVWGVSRQGVTRAPSVVESRSAREASPSSAG